MRAERSSPMASGVGRMRTGAVIARDSQGMEGYQHSLGLHLRRCVDLDVTMHQEIPMTKRMPRTTLRTRLARWLTIRVDAAEGTPSSYVFHPMGVVRVLTPAEQARLDRADRAR